jgi:hypothetical protein
LFNQDSGFKLIQFLYMLFSYMVFTQLLVKLAPSLGGHQRKDIYIEHPIAGGK